MKVLQFYFRGQKYLVKETREIKANGLDYFSEDWIFMGGSHHHWCTHITLNRIDAFNNPELLNGCLGWDIDHGTVRQWGGCYNGKLPRIEKATIIEI